MSILKSSDYRTYSKFIENLAKKLTKFYYLKLDKPFKVSNKLQGKGYDPVTTADKAFEKFIRNVSIIVLIILAIYILYGLISYPITAQ